MDDSLRRSSVRLSLLAGASGDVGAWGTVFDDSTPPERGRSGRCHAG
jgi:hypothetical protein